MINDSVYEKMESVVDNLGIVIVVLCVLALIFGLCLTIREKKRKNKGAWSPLIAGFVALGGAILALVLGWLMENPDAGIPISSSDSSIYYLGVFLLIVSAYGWGTKSHKHNRQSDELINMDKTKEVEK